MNIVPMIVISLMAGLLSTMNVWAVTPSHIRIHLNDMYMIGLMTSWMIVLDGIYNQRGNTLVVVGILGVSLFMYLIRNQVFVNDSEFMKGMIPHHSMAILMAEKIKEKSRDDKIIKLANDIIVAQNKEIEYIQKLGY